MRVKMRPLTNIKNRRVLMPADYKTFLNDKCRFAPAVTGLSAVTGLLPLAPIVRGVRPGGRL
jgi:hypothetical protein